MPEIETMLLRAMAQDLSAIREHLGETAGQSSVQIAASARGRDVTVKCYAGSPVREAGDAAIAEYVRVVHEVEAQLLNGASKP